MGRIEVKAGTIEHRVANGTLTWIGTDYDKEIYTDLGDDKMMRLYEVRLTNAKYQEQMSN